MGFYYNSGGPPDDDKPGGWRETIAIIWAVFQALALPLAFIFGGVAYLVVLLYLFTVNALFALAWLLVAVIAVVARGVWEAKHPPELR